MNSKKKGMSLIAKQRAAGWTFLAPASILIAIMSFYPMVRAFIISLQKGTGANMRFTGFSNYQRILVDKVFQQSIGNTFFYLIIQVPIMLILAILLAQLLNNKHLKLRGLFRTCVFLPCATSLVSYSLIFRSMFATDGLINSILMKLGILHSGYNFLGHSGSAKAVIILALIWRWTGYNMVFYLAGLQNIEYSVYEAAKIDGANGWKTFWRITVPLLKPTLRCEAPHLSIIRQIAFSDLNQCMAEILYDTLHYLSGRKGSVDPTTQLTYQFYEPYGKDQPWKH